MKNYVQLKDGIVFAHISTEGEIPTSNEVIEVESDGSIYLNKKYDNGNFINAPIIKYAIIDEQNDNTIIDIKQTLFSSDLKPENKIITNPDVRIFWKWNGTDFEAPYVAPIYVDSVRSEPAAIESSSSTEESNTNIYQEPTTPVEEPTTPVEEPTTPVEEPTTPVE